VLIADHDIGCRIPPFKRSVTNTC